MNKDVKAYLKRLRPGYTFDTGGAHIAILDPRGRRIATVGKNTYGYTLRKNIAQLEKMGALELTQEAARKVVRSRMPAPAKTVFTEEEKKLIATTVGAAGSMSGFARHAIEIAKESDGQLRAPGSVASFAISVSNVLDDKAGVTDWVKELMLATARDIADVPPIEEPEPEPEPAPTPTAKTDQDRIGELLGALALAEDETEELKRKLAESGEREEELRRATVGQQNAEALQRQLESERSKTKELRAEIKMLEQRLQAPSPVNREALRKFVVSARKGEIDQDVLVELAFSLLED